MDAEERERADVVASAFLSCARRTHGYSDESTAFCGKMCGAAMVERED